MQAAKRKRLRLQEPPLPMDNRNERSWVCDEQGAIVAYMNYDAFAGFRWGLWTFMQEAYPMPPGEELDIWSDNAAPEGISGKRLGIMEITLISDSHAASRAYREEGKTRLLPGRFDLYVPRAAFKTAFLASNAIGRRRRGSTLNTVTLFDAIRIVRLPNGLWPVQTQPEMQPQL